MAGFPTRIQNNQITSNTIIASQKIVPQTIVGSLFAPDISVVSNITILGNLIIANSNAYTSINSINTYVNDPIVVFNNGYTGSPTYDIGILVNRNLQAMSPTNYGSLNTAWVWRETEESFAGILTTETGTTTGSVNETAYANLTIGNTTVRTTAGTNVVDSVTSATGALQVQGGVGILGNTTHGGSLVAVGATTGAVTIGGNVGITHITQAASTRYGVLLTDTNNNGALALGTGTAFGARIQTFSGTNNDIIIQPNRLLSMHLFAANGSVNIENNINSSNPNVGAITVTGSGGVAIGGNLNVGTSASFETNRLVLVAPAAQANTITVGSGTLTTGLAAQVTVFGTGIGATSVGARSTIVGAQAANNAPGTDTTAVGFGAGGQVSGTNNQFFGSFAGNAVTTGNFNVILGANTGAQIATKNNQVIVSDGQGTNRISIDNTGNVYVWSGVNSTGSNTGALVVQGGVGTGGNLNVGGAASFASGRVVLDASVLSLVLAANTATSLIGNVGITVIGQGIDSTAPVNIGTGSTLIGTQALNTGSSAQQITAIGYRTGYNGIPGQNSTMVGALAGQSASGLQNQLFGYSAGSSNLLTGNYNVVLGAYDGNAIGSTSNMVYIADGQGNPRIIVDNTGSTTVVSSVISTGVGTGAIITPGGISAAKDSNFGANVTIAGNLFVTGNTITIGAQDLTVQDSIVNIHTFANNAPLISNDGRDIGIAFHYYDTQDRVGAFVRQNISGFAEFYANATETAGNVFTNYTYGTIKTGEFVAANTTASTSQITGAIRVAGGVGVQGRVTANNAVIDNNFTSSGVNAVVSLQPSGASGTVTIAPAQGAATGTMNNMDIGTSYAATGAFKDISITTGSAVPGRNAVFSGNGFVQIQPTGTVTIAPVATGNMDNVFIGNTTPRQATFTSANVASDFKLTSFSSNSILFIDSGTNAVTSNLAITQRNAAFNFQVTGNTFSGYGMYLGHAAQNDLLVQGTDTLNIRYQGDSYLPQSLTAANTLSQSSGWTVSTTRGTPTAPLINQDGDFNGVFGAYAYSGATPQFYETGSWRYVVQGTTAASSGIGGQAQLWTKRDNGASALALRVDASQVATFYGQVVVANSTTTTNSTSGALYVQGGQSIGGNLVVAQSVRLNDTQNANRDFIVRGQNDATLIWASTATYNQVLVGNSAISANLVTGAKLQINSTDSILLPVGTTAQEPGGASGYGSAVPGMFRFNSDFNDIEYYDGSKWYRPKTAQITTVQDWQFSGGNVNGVNTTFVIGASTTSNSTFITLNGVLQTPSTAYIVTSDIPSAGQSTITFSEAPISTDAIDVRAVALTATVSGIASANAFDTITAPSDNSGVLISTGSTSANAAVKFLNNGAVVYYSASNVAIGTSALVIDSFDAAQYRSAKYVIQVTNPGSGQYEVSDVMVLQDGTTATRTQYNRIYTGAAAMGNVTATLSAGTVYVFYQGATTGNYVKHRADYITI